MDGDLILAGNSSFNNSAIFATGRVIIGGSAINFNNNCMVVAQDSILMGDAFEDLHLISNNLGGAVYVSYKDILLFGFGTINGGALCANRNVYLGGNFNITYDKSTVDHGFCQYLVSNWSVK